MKLDDPIGRSRKRTLSLLFLLALNAGTAHILTSQIVSRVMASQGPLILNEQVSADAATALDDTAPITPVSTPEKTGEITTYIVQSGDTIGEIAEGHGISTNTVRWANDLGDKGTIKPGDKLTILPVSGIQYTVKKGDTVSGIATRYDVESETILDMNNFADASSIKVGAKIIIPGGEPIAEAVKKAPAKTATKTVETKPSSSSASSSSSVSTGYYAKPTTGIITQSKHDSYAVDIGTPVGTIVKAAAKGTVSVAKGGGDYNGGYGNYIVIDHPNGTSTLYGHLSSVSVSVGDSVKQGETIGKSGNTGRSTGPHLHFEVKGATNPFFKYKVGTRL